jgi:hypothetical protein
LGGFILVSFFLGFRIVLGIQSIPSREEKGLKEGGAAVGSKGCGFRGFGPEAGKVVDSMDRAGILVGKNREGEATGADGRKELFGSVGGENQEGVIGRFFQCFEESVCRFGRGKTHPFCFKNQGDFECGPVWAAGKGMLQLADLGDRNPTGLRFRTEDEEVGMSFQFGIEEVGGETSSKRLQFHRRCAGQKVRVGQSALLGGSLKKFLNAGGRKRHGGVPSG